MTFGEKLLMLRKEKNFSQEELAEKIGVSRQAVSRWESGETMPDSPNLLQISNLFGVSADYLLRDDYKSEVPAPEKEKPKTRKILFGVYIFGLLGMAALFYIFALSDLDMVYWAAGTIFLIAGIISALIFFKKPETELKSPAYLAASIIFFAAAVIGFCTVGNIGFIMGTGNLFIAVILFIMFAAK